MKCFTIDSLMETVNRNFMSYSIAAIVSGCEPLQRHGGKGVFVFQKKQMSIWLSKVPAVSVHWCLGFLDGMLKLVVSSHYESFGATKYTRVQGEITRMP